MREKERRLEGRDLLLVGSTLLPMFFGASNPIFPPSIVAQAGTQTWPVMLGLAPSAVGLSTLGMVAVACSGGLDTLGSRVHPVFARVFITVVYLVIDSCLAIPWTATISSEMAVPPFVGADVPIGVYQPVYSLVFFTAALFTALWPEKPTDRPDKILCPIPVAPIAVTFVGCLVNPLEDCGPAAGNCATHAVVKGFIEGYQIMDAIAASASGIVIAMNIHARGVEEEGTVVQDTVWVGVVVGGMLLVVYCMPAHIGALSGGAPLNLVDGAETLINVVGLLLSTVGSVLLVGIFLIACFNVCVGLISSRGEYLHSICPRLSYRGWAVLFVLVSMAIFNAGLAQILEVSVPVLSVIYPAAIVLIALSFLQRRSEGRRRVCPVTALCTGALSVLFALKGLKVPLDFLDALPLADVGLG